MIYPTKFPSVEEDIFSNFTKVKNDPTDFIGNSYASLLCNLYNDNWKSEFFHVNSPEELYKKFLSSDLSSTVSFWKDSNTGNSTNYLVGEPIPSNKDEFYTGFPTDLPNTILNLNADFGRILDTSLKGSSLEIRSKNVSIAEDPVFGKVMRFNPKSNPSSIDDYSFIEVDDFLASLISNGKNLRLNLGTDLSTDSYFMVVLAKIGNQKVKSGNTIEEDSGITLLSRRTKNSRLDSNHSNPRISQYFFSLKESNLSVNVQTLSALDFGMFTLSNDHSLNSDFSLDKFKNRWTLYVLELTKRKSRDSDPHTVIAQNFSVNPPIRSYVDFNGAKFRNTCGKSNYLEATMPNSPLTVEHQYDIISNIEMMRGNADRSSYISRMAIVKQVLASGEAISTNLGINQGDYENTSLYVGLDVKSSENNDIFHFLEDTDIKFIKIIKSDPSWNFESIIAREYYNSVFLPRKNRLESWKLEDHLSEVVEDKKTSDSSIVGEYLKLDSSLEFSDNIFSKKVFSQGNLQTKSFMIDTWLSCEDYFNICILSSDVFMFTLSNNSHSTDDAAYVQSRNTKLSSWIGDIYQIGNTNSQNYFLDDVDARHLPFKISNDRKWHHLAVIYQIGNPETGSSSNAKLAVYIDGLSYSKRLADNNSIQYFITDMEIPSSKIDLEPESPRNVLTINPLGAEMNIRSLNYYVQNVNERYLNFFQDQDVFNLYLNGIERYRPNEEGFVLNQYWFNYGQVTQEHGAVYTVSDYIWIRDNSWYATPIKYDRILVAHSMRNKTLNFFSTPSLSGASILSTMPDQRIHHRILEATEFPNIHDGYPYANDYNAIEDARYGIVMDISGLVNISEPRSYCVHFIVDNCLSLRFEAVDDPADVFSFTVENKAPIAGQGFSNNMYAARYDNSSLSIQYFYPGQLDPDPDDWAGASIRSISQFYFEKFTHTSYKVTGIFGANAAGYLGDPPSMNTQLYVEMAPWQSDWNNNSLTSVPGYCLNVIYTPANLSLFQPIVAI